MSSLCRASSTSWHVSLITIARGSKVLYTRWPKPNNLNGSFLSLARAMYWGILSTEPISSNIRKQASLAPPWAGPHREATPAAIHAYGLAPEEPANLTDEVEAFCSWSAWRVKILSKAFSTIGFTLYSSHGVENIMCRKLPV